MWGGRFAEGPSAVMREINASIPFDKRMWQQDIAGSQAHAAMLAAYADPKLGLSTGLNANLPTTILYDAAGKELWRVQGAMEWTGSEARTLLGEAGV